MSSNAEQVSNAGAQAMAREALLREIGKRAPSPTQAVKVCQILGLATRENIRRVREIAKFAKNQIASEAENKNPEERKMEVQWGNRHIEKIRGKKTEKIEKIVKRLIPNTLLCSIENTGKVLLLYNSVTVMDIYQSSQGDREESDYSKLPPLCISVFEGRFLSTAKKIARNYEKKTGQSVMIVKQY